MIGANVHWPWWRRAGGPPPITRAVKGTAGVGGASVTIPNMTLGNGELLAVFLEHDIHDIFQVTGVAWGANALTQQASVPFWDAGLVHVAELWSYLAAGAGTNNLVVTVSGIVNIVVVAVGYSTVSSNVRDQLVSDFVPNAGAGFPPDSGLTGATAQAHELVLGCIGFSPQLGGPFGPGFVAPMNTGQAEYIAGMEGDQVQEGWYEATAIGTFRAAYVSGDGVSPWAAICCTFRLP